jgi:hypothetical protein
MRKRVQIAITVWVVAVVGMVVWQILRPQEREPVYQGRRLSIWLDRYVTDGSVIDVQPDPEVDEAVRQISTNALPTLLRMLKTRDSKLKLELVRLGSSIMPEFVRVPDFVRIPALPSYYPIWEAATAFHALGAKASNAVPLLIQVFRAKICLDSQRACVQALGWVGPAAHEAIPELLTAATNSDTRLRALAGETLGRIHAEPELVLPVLAKSLTDANSGVRMCAAYGLGSFAARARQEVAVLVPLLDDPEQGVREAAALALLRMDTELAAKAQVIRVLTNCLRGDGAGGVCVETVETLQGLGTNVQQVVPALVLLLDDPREPVRKAATNALQQIDAEAAVKAGVK